MCSIVVGTKAINLTGDRTGQLCEVGLLATSNGSLALFIRAAQLLCVTEGPLSKVFGVFLSNQCVTAVMLTCSSVPSFCTCLLCKVPQQLLSQLQAICFHRIVLDFSIFLPFCMCFLLQMLFQITTDDFLCYSPNPSQWIYDCCKILYFNLIFIMLQTIPSKFKFVFSLFKI